MLIIGMLIARGLKSACTVNDIWVMLKPCGGRSGPCSAAGRHVTTTAASVCLLYRPAEGSHEPITLWTNAASASALGCSRQGGDDG